MIRNRHIVVSAALGLILVGSIASFLLFGSSRDDGNVPAASKTPKPMEDARELTNRNVAEASDVHAGLRSSARLTERDVSRFNIFSFQAIGAQSGYDGVTDVETALEKGLLAAEASPTHIVIRGIAQSGTVRCNWRGVARTPEQREQAIRFWLQVDPADSIPSASEVETRFNEILGEINPAFLATAKANFTDLARGGLSTKYLFLSCFADFQVQEYLLGSGATTITVAYDRLAESRSYELYRLAHEAGEIRGDPLLDEGPYRDSQDRLRVDVEEYLAEIVEERDSVVFLAPMGEHNAIGIEAWQAVAQWDIQTSADSTEMALRYGAPNADPEYTQTLANLRARIDAAASSDQFSDSRIPNTSGLSQRYHDIGAYDDITPGDGDSTTFTPAQPPAALTCATGSAITNPGSNRQLVHDCEALLDIRDALAGTATLNWSADTAIGSWAGITTGGTPTRVTKLVLPSKSLTGTIPPDIASLFNLEELDLSSNQLTGEIPSSLGDLTNLTKWRLAGNHLTGCVPSALEAVPDSDSHLWACPTARSRRRRRGPPRSRQEPAEGTPRWR